MDDLGNVGFPYNNNNNCNNNSSSGNMNGMDMGMDMNMDIAAAANAMLNMQAGAVDGMHMHAQQGGGGMDMGMSMGVPLGFGLGMGMGGGTGAGLALPQGGMGGGAVDGLLPGGDDGWAMSERFLEELSHAVNASPAGMAPQQPVAANAAGNLNFFAGPCGPAALFGDADLELLHEIASSAASASPTSAAGPAADALAYMAALSGVGGGIGDCGVDVLDAASALSACTSSPAALCGGPDANQEGAAGETPPRTPDRNDAGASVALPFPNTRDNHIDFIESVKTSREALQAAGGMQVRVDAAAGDGAHFDPMLLKASLDVALTKDAATHAPAAWPTSPLGARSPTSAGGSPPTAHAAPPRRASATSGGGAESAPAASVNTAAAAVRKAMAMTSGADPDGADFSVPTTRKPGKGVRRASIATAESGRSEDTAGGDTENGGTPATSALRTPPDVASGSVLPPQTNEYAAAAALAAANMAGGSGAGMSALELQLQQLQLLQAQQQQQLLQQQGGGAAGWNQWRMLQAMQNNLQNIQQLNAATLQPGEDSLSSQYQLSMMHTVASATLKEQARHRCEQIRTSQAQALAAAQRNTPSAGKALGGGGGANGNKQNVCSGSVVRNGKFKPIKAAHVLQLPGSRIMVGVNKLDPPAPKTQPGRD